MKYTVVVSKDPESATFMASVPALPGCHTWGKTRSAAFKNALEAIQVYIDGLRKMADRGGRYCNPSSHSAPS